VKKGRFRNEKMGKSFRISEYIAVVVRNIKLPQTKLYICFINISLLLSQKCLRVQ